MIDPASVLYAFGAGALGAFNPCGFVLLPTYAAAFLAADTHDESGPSVVRVSIRLGAGFLALFTVAGIAVGAVGQALPNSTTPALALVTAAFLAAAGALMLLGVRLPGMNLTLGSTRTAFSYGVAYAAASLACAFPVFLSAVVFSFARSGGLLTGVLAGAAYGAGMSLVVSIVIAAAAASKTAFIARARASSSHFSRAAGTLLLGASVFLAARELWGFAALDSVAATVQSALDQQLWLFLLSGGSLAALLHIRSAKRRTSRYSSVPSDEQTTAQ